MGGWEGLSPWLAGHGWHILCPVCAEPYNPSQSGVQKMEEMCPLQVNLCLCLEQGKEKRGTGST